MITTDLELPILYSFRRCPYAMRARLAVHASGISVELREILLKEKPQSMLDASSKGTVPVLVLSDGDVIDESLDIMYWALATYDPHNWYASLSNKLKHQSDQLIQRNDLEFKPWLDKYKYAVRYPEHSPQDYRKNAETFLQTLETNLTQHQYLLTDHATLADYAIFPFIRQFAFVDKTWFDNSRYHSLKNWLENFLKSDNFLSIMKKFPKWQPGHKPRVFPPLK